MTRREPVWTEQDRAEVLAYQLFKDLLCPCGCGQKTEDSLSSEVSGPQFRARRVACRARMAIIDAQDAANQDQNPYAAARLWTVDKIAR